MGRLPGDSARDEFIASLNQLIRKTESGPPFKGKTVAIRAMRRILTLSALR